MKTPREDLHPFEYGIGLVSLVVLAAGLNILDAVFTQVIAAAAGTERSPAFRAAVDACGGRLWIWKAAAVSFLLVLVCLCGRLKLFRAIHAGPALLFAGVLSRQLHRPAKGPPGR